MDERELRDQTEAVFGDLFPYKSETFGSGKRRKEDPFKGLIGRQVTLPDGTKAIAYDLGQKGALPASDKRGPAANWGRGRLR